MVILGYLFQLLAIVLAISIFFVPRRYKCGLLLLEYILFADVPLPGLSPLSLGCLALFFSLIKSIKTRRRFARQIQPIVYYVALLILLLLFTVFVSAHLHSLRDLYSYIMTECVCKYGVLVLVYLCVKEKRDIYCLAHMAFIALIIITVFGFFNLIIGTPIYSLCENLNFSEIDYGERFRISSTFYNPFDYGFVCVVFLLFSLFLFFTKQITAALFGATMGMSLFGIIFCGCRTIIIITIIGIASFLLLSNRSIKKSLKVFSLFLGLMVIAYAIAPSIQNKVKFMLSAFEMDSEISGSSISGRSIQLAAVINEIKDNPLTGNGYGYFVKDLGWGAEGMTSDNPDLLGIEGVYMSYLLERGIVGFLLYLLMISCLVCGLVRLRNIVRSLYALGISTLIIYLSFSFLTGELLSFFPTAIIVGMVLSILQAAKTRIKRIEHR